MIGTSAILSDDGVYRYELTRTWSDVGALASVFMVNPSTADAATDDPTIRKLKGFAIMQKWRGFIVANKHAFRATDVNDLKTANDPIGPLNGGHLLATMLKTDISVVAWGSLAKLPPELREGWRTVATIARAVNRPLYCWGVCADGHPKHPVMLGYDNPLVEWKAPL